MTFRTKARLAAGLLAGLCLLPHAWAHAEGEPKTHVVEIEAMQFSPSTLEVHPGDTIVWRNKDPFPHTATAENKGFDSGSIASGRSWKFKAAKKGTFPYVCTLHPTMKATLIVK